MEFFFVCVYLGCECWVLSFPRRRQGRVGPVGAGGLGGGDGSKEIFPSLRRIEVISRPVHPAGLSC